MKMFEAEWLLRLLAAMAAGIIIGFERYFRSKEAGIRTHTMVSVGACLLMLISKYGFTDINAGDPARIAAQVVSGIGFLGAGIIFVRQDMVHGLTTATGIWATSAIGLAYGAGMYLLGGVATILIVIIQHVLLRYLPHNSLNMGIKLKVHMMHDDGIDEVMEVLSRNHFNVVGQNRFTSDGKNGWYLYCDAVTYKDSSPEKVVRELSSSDKIISVEVI